MAIVNLVLRFFVISLNYFNDIYFIVGREIVIGQRILKTARLKSTWREYQLHGQKNKRDTKAGEQAPD